MAKSPVAEVTVLPTRNSTAKKKFWGARASESAVMVFVVGFTLVLLLWLFRVVTDPLVGFLLQVLVVFGSIVWGARAYFLARAETKKGITPGCAGTENVAVIFLTAEPTSWRFRFYSRTYAEQFAAANPGGYLTTLYLD